jgi:hypothetical protein
VVHFFLLGIILVVGILVGLNWETLKKTTLPSAAELRVHVGHSLQNASAAIKNFVKAFDFFSSPNEGGVATPSNSMDSLLPGQIGAGGMAPAFNPNATESPSVQQPECKPLYDQATGNIVPGKCLGDAAVPPPPQPPPASACLLMVKGVCVTPSPQN